jgi:hypothetical protein
MKLSPIKLFLSKLVGNGFIEKVIDQNLEDCQDFVTDFVETCDQRTVNHIANFNELG